MNNRNRPFSPLIDDEYADSPGRRVLARLQAEKEAGRPAVGIYCCYAPLELIWAAGAVPVGLCATSQKPIPKAETILPANLCPLIKSSFGFIITDTCPFFKLSDLIVAETTCDGKKKMFELISDIKPMLTLELPQTPDYPASFLRWLESVRQMKAFLEKSLNLKITDQDIEAAIKEANQRRSLFLEIAGYARYEPPLITWIELKELAALIGVFPGDEVRSLMLNIIEKLEKRARHNNSGGDRRVRVMVTGCPLGGDAEKVYQVIEELDGRVVAQEACSGLKPLWTNIVEDTSDPLEAIARRYLDLPCSCMTPNTRRWRYMGDLIEKFKPDCIIDVVLSGCHTYNVESHLIKEHAKNELGLPFLKIETDYSEMDVVQIQVRIGALLEMIRT